MRQIARMLGWAAVAWAATSLPGRAELKDRDEFMTETLSIGQLSVVVDYSSGHQRERLMLNGVPILGMEARHVYIQEALRFQSGANGIWRLIRLESGDPGCPSLWAVVVITRQGATATDPFGTCADKLLSADSVDGSWRLTMDQYPTRKGHTARTYLFDGSTLILSP